MKDLKIKTEDIYCVSTTLFAKYLLCMYLYSIYMDVLPLYGCIA